MVVERVLHPSVFSGFGIRALNTGYGGYRPTRYYCGSVCSR